MTAHSTLRADLEAVGFRISPNPIPSQMNECRWIAHRRTSLPARECELNDGKTMQIVVTPNAFDINGMRHESVEIDLTGEFGNWWKLCAYGVKPDELIDKLPAIEAQLIAAWNALEKQT